MESKTYIGLKTLFKREGTDRSYTFTRIHNTANSVTDVHRGLGQLWRLYGRKSDMLYTPVGQTWLFLM